MHTSVSSHLERSGNPGGVLAAIPRSVAAEILVVDCLFEDGTPAIAEAGGARLISEPRAALAGLAPLESAQPRARSWFSWMQTALTTPGIYRSWWLY